MLSFFFSLQFNSFSYIGGLKGANFDAAFNWGDRIYYTVMGDWEPMSDCHGRMRVLKEPKGY